MTDVLDRQISAADHLSATKGPADRPRLVVIDTETTGLDPTVHQMYEVAWTVITDPGVWAEPPTVHSLIVPHTLDGSDPAALAVGRYHERDIAHRKVATVVQLARLYDDLQGATLANFNVRFDAAMLEQLSRRLYRLDGLANQPWHHRMLDLSSYAAGILNLPVCPLPSSYEVACRLGVPHLPDHTAAGDVRSALECLVWLGDRRRP